VLWPRTGFTKGDLIDYYRDVAGALLPHLAGRPVTLGRWPQGVDARGFGQSECRGRPSWMRVAELRLRGGQVRRHCLIDDTASLVWVANLSTI
jgi:bifunctional non-homologous end joining protein LigD